MRIYHEKVLDSSKINAEEYVIPSKINITELRAILEEILSSINDKYFKLILKNIFNNKSIRKKYYNCPSSIGFHHSYRYGNLQNVVSMIKTFNTLVNNYEFLIYKVNIYISFGSFYSQ